MLSWWRNHTLRKQARHLIKGTRKMLRMQRDLMDPQRMSEVAGAAESLAGAVRARQTAAIPELMEKLERQLERAFPRQPFASLRENVEVFLVAAIVAMAVRTFFIQPFKIPTGSMQPTLYGFYPPAPDLLPYPANQQPSLPEKLFGMIFTGKIYQEFGYRSRGDHIFVDRFTYHFRKPERGEIVVFDTTDIADIPEASRGKFYIKRLIGVGGDTVQINSPFVLVNGQVLNGRDIFAKIYSRENGYTGYLIPRSFPPPKYLPSEHAVYKIPEKGLFVLGDNSASSLDGRYWGAVEGKALVGRAVFVYWPFTRRFGLID